MITRFGHDADPICMQMDEVLASVADPIKNFAVIYLVDITEVRSPPSPLPDLTFQKTSSGLHSVCSQNLSLHATGDSIQRHV